MRSGETKDMKNNAAERIEARTRRLELGLEQLGMVEIFKPRLGREDLPSYASKNWWDVVPVPGIERKTVYIFSHDLDRYVEWLFSNWDKNNSVERLYEFLEGIGCAAFKAWSNSIPHCGEKGDSILREFCGTLVAQRNEFGGPGPMLPWIQHVLSLWGVDDKVLGKPEKPAVEAPKDDYSVVGYDGDEY